MSFSFSEASAMHVDYASPHVDTEITQVKSFNAALTCGCGKASCTSKAQIILCCQVRPMPVSDHDVGAQLQAPDLILLRRLFLQRQVAGLLQHIKKASLHKDSFADLLLKTKHHSSGSLLTACAAYCKTLLKHSNLVKSRHALKQT